MTLSSVSAQISADVTSIRGTNKLKQYLTDKDANAYGNSLFLATYIWSALFVAFGLGYCVCFWWAICDCCGCCKCCRDYAIKPVTTTERRNWGLCVLLTGLVMSGFAIAAIVLSAQAANGIKGTACGLALLLDDFVDGTTVYRNGKPAAWSGLTNGLTGLQTLADNVRAAPNKISNAVTVSTTNIDQDYLEMNGRITSMSNRYSDKLGNPDILTQSSDGSTVESALLKVTSVSSRIE
jgi:hypothetical protein